MEGVAVALDLGDDVFGGGLPDEGGGLPVLTSTQFTAGTVVLMDTTIYGRVVVREALITRIGFSGTDFTDNVVRFVSEERLAQTVERPQAICVISGLPTTATDTTAKPATRSGSK